MTHTEFNWLHLSDLHWNDKRLKASWSQVSKEFYDDLEIVYEKVKPVDAIIFSGDLACKGKVEEFTAFVSKMKELIEWLEARGSKGVKFLCVPGNHDLVRLKEDEEDELENSEAITALEGWLTNKRARDTFFSNQNSRARVFIGQRFSHYCNFLASSGLPFPADIQYGIIPGDFSATIEKETIEKNKYRFGFIGLNSAFLHLSDKADKYNIAVDINQFQSVCSGRGTQNWCDENTINMLITHHPPEWLTGADKPKEVHRDFKSDIAPPGRFQAHLFGHLHKARTTNYSISSSEFTREYQAASLFGVERSKDGKDEKIHGYSACKIIIENEKSKIRCWHRKRVKKEDGHYEIERDDTCTFVPGTEYFEYEFLLKNVKTKDEPPEPAKPRSTHLPTSNVLGRDDVIEEVAGLLRDPNRRLITLLGPPGIGKTTIANVLKDKVKADFKDGVYFCPFQEIEALDGLIAKLNAEIAHLQDAKEDTLFRWLDNKSSLLILDNFEDPLTDRANVESFIERLLAQTSGVKLLITSRERINLSDIEEVVNVDILNRTDSEELLRKLAGKLKLSVHLKDVDLNGLLDELGDVPLAIVLTASNLALGVDYLTNELKNQNIDVLTKYGIKIEDANKNKSVAKSFFLSYSKIKDNNDRLLFLVCSLFPAGLKKADAKIILPANTQQNFASLESKSLISPFDRNTYTMLAPIRTYAYGMFKKMIDKNEIDIGILARWINLCVNKSVEYYNTPRGTGKRAIKELINELPDIFRVIEYLILKSEKDVLLKILFNLSDFSSFVGITKEVMSSLEKAKQITNKAGDIYGEAYCIMSMGHCVIRDNQTTAGIEEVFKAIKIYEKIGDKYSIGVAYLNLGRELEGKEGFQEKALEYKMEGEEILNNIELAM